MNEHERGFDSGYSAAIHDARQEGSRAHHELAKTEVRLSRDAKIPKGSTVEVTVELVYRIPWDDELDIYNEQAMSLDEYLRATGWPSYNVAQLARAEHWELIDDQEDSFIVIPPAEDTPDRDKALEVEQTWENESRKRGGFVPSEREYREVLS